MTKILKALLLLAVVGALVWVASMWHWHSRQIDPTETELLIYLVVVPLVVTIAMLLAIWQLQKMKLAAAVPIIPVLSARAQAKINQALPVAPEPPPPLIQPFNDFKVLATHVTTRTAPGWDQAQADIQAGSLSPKPNALWKDRRGFPVFAAEVPDLALDKVTASWTGEAAPAEAVRALALLSETLDALAHKVRVHWPVLGDPVPMEQDLQKSGPPKILIAVALSDRWLDSTRASMVRWIELQTRPLIEEGLRMAGQSMAMLSTPQAAISLSVWWVGDEQAWWDQVQTTTDSFVKSGGVPRMIFLLSADSMIGTTSIHGMEDAGQLFGPRQPKGKVPGEASTGLLLANDFWLKHPACPIMAAASLHRGPLETHLLASHIDQALLATEQKPDEISHVTLATAPQEQSAAMDASQQTFPHLDPTEHFLSLAHGCGNTGMGSDAMCLAFAAGKTQLDAAAGLLLGCQQFPVVLVRPA